MVSKIQFTGVENNTDRILRYTETHTHRRAAVNPQSVPIMILQTSLPVFLMCRTFDVEA